MWKLINIFLTKGKIIVKASLKSLMLVTTQPSRLESTIKWILSQDFGCIIKTNIKLNIYNGWFIVSVEIEWEILELLKKKWHISRKTIDILETTFVFLFSSYH